MTPKIVHTKVATVKVSHKKSRKCNVCRKLFDLCAAIASDTWWFELVSLILGCALMILLCLLLWRYDRQPVPNFGSSFGTVVTLNTVTAILGAAIIACLMYPVVESLGQLKWQRLVHKQRALEDLSTIDKATRGMLGSVMMLWTFRCGNISCLGGLLVVLAITMTPFFQQLIAIAPQQTAIPNSPLLANVAVVQRYNEYWDDRLQDNATYSPWGNTLSPRAGAALLSGLLRNSSSIIPPSEPFCSTGNCTFNNYLSLAVCADFQDISSHVVTNPTAAGNQSYAKVVNISIPFEIDSRLVLQTIDQNQSIVFSQADAAISRAVILYADFAPAAPVAYEFMLSWCTQELRSVVNGGTADSKVVSSSPVIPSGTWNQINGTANNASSFFPSGGISVDRITTARLTSYLSGLLTSRYTWSDGPFLVEGQAAILFWQAYQATSATGMSNMVSNIAVSFSNYMRSSEALDFTDQSFQIVSGTALQEIAIVVIRWYWIIGPGVFAGLSILFFAVCMFNFHWRKDRLPAWKTSVMPLVYAADGGMRHSSSGMKSTTLMDAEAKQISIRLQSHSSKPRWELVLVTRSHETTL